MKPDCILNLVRDNIRSLEPYSTARDEYQGTPGILLDANENPFGNGLNRYPSAALRRCLLEKIASFKGFPPEETFLGNGSDECIDLCYRVFCRPGVDNALMIAPSYGMYRVLADINGVESRSIPLGTGFSLPVEEILARCDRHSRLLFLCSPNNPTGNTLSFSGILRLLEEFPGMVVVDEAYADFSTQPGLASLVPRYPNLIVLQTLSKAFGMAGLRIGIARADRSVVTLFDRVRYPYNIGTDTLKLALETLDPERSAWEIAVIRAERDRLATALSETRCILAVFPSDAYFLLVRTQDPKALYRHLLTRGIIVRDRSSAPGCEGTLRLSVGTPEENDRLIRTITEYDNV